MNDTTPETTEIIYFGSNDRQVETITGLLYVEISRLKSIGDPLLDEIDSPISNQKLYTIDCTYQERGMPSRLPVRVRNIPRPDKDRWDVGDPKGVVFVFDKLHHHSQEDRKCIPALQQILQYQGKGGIPCYVQKTTDYEQPKLMGHKGVGYGLDQDLDFFQVIGDCTVNIPEPQRTILIPFQMMMRHLAKSSVQQRE